MTANGHAKPPLRTTWSQKHQFTKLLEMVLARMARSSGFSIKRGLSTVKMELRKRKKDCSNKNSLDVSLRLSMLQRVIMRFQGLVTLKNLWTGNQHSTKKTWVKERCGKIHTLTCSKSCPFTTKMMVRSAKKPQAKTSLSKMSLCVEKSNREIR